MSIITSALNKHTVKTAKPSELEKFRLFFEYVETGTKKEEHRKVAHRIIQRPRRLMPLGR